MNDNEKVLTYDEAKQLCRAAFDGGALYGQESMRYHVNAVAYDWEHWLAKNERLFRPKPTVEDVLRELVRGLLWCRIDDADAKLCPLYDEGEPYRCRKDKLLRELGINAVSYESPCIAGNLQELGVDIK